MTSVRESITSCESFESCCCETKIALQAEWCRMLATSLADESGRIGTVTRPNGTQENIATVQLGMLLDRMATLSPAPMPKRLKRCESSRHLCLKLS